MPYYDFSTASVAKIKSLTISEFEKHALDHIDGVSLKTVLGILLKSKKVNLNKHICHIKNCLKVAVNKKKLFLKEGLYTVPNQIQRYAERRRQIELARMNRKRSLDIEGDNGDEVPPKKRAKKYEKQKRVAANSVAAPTHFAASNSRIYPWPRSPREGTTFPSYVENSTAAEANPLVLRGTDDKKFRNPRNNAFKYGKRQIFEHSSSAPTHFAASNSRIYPWPRSPREGTLFSSYVDNPKAAEVNPLVWRNADDKKFRNPGNNAFKYGERQIFEHSSSAISTKHQSMSSTSEAVNSENRKKMQGRSSMVSFNRCKKHSDVQLHKNKFRK